MENLYEILFLKILGLTIFIELLVLLICYKSIKINTNYISLIFVGILCTFATLPYVRFVFPAFIKQKLIYTIVSEVFAVAVETMIYKNFLNISWKTAFGVSFCCNMISFGIGKFLFVLRILGI